MLYSNFARLVDQAVREYEAARETLLAYVDAKPGEQLGLVFPVQSHLETCVHALLRACRFATVLSERPKAPLIDKDEVLSDDDVETLRGFRNAQEHLEERILDGKIPPGSASTVCVLDDEVRVAGKVISYTALGDWITKLHKLAMRLAGIREEPL